MMNELRKIKLTILPEKRFQDFVISIWYGGLQKGAKSLTLRDIVELLRNHIEEEGRRGTLRSLNYFYTRLEDWLVREGENAIQDFVDKIKPLRIHIENFENVRGSIRDSLEQDRITPAQIIDGICLSLSWKEESSPRIIEDLLVKLRPLMEIENVGYRRFAERLTLNPRTRQPHDRSSIFRNFFDSIATPYQRLLNIAQALRPYTSQVIAIGNIVDIVLNSTTPLEQLLSVENDREASLFVKAIHAIALAQEKQRELNQELSRLKQLLKGQNQNLTSTLENIERFNAEVGNQILICREISQARAFLQDLISVMETYEPLSVATLLFLSRVLNRVIERIGELNGRTGQTFNAWVQILSPLREANRVMEDIEDSLEESFKSYSSIKESYPDLGGKSQLKSDLQSKLTESKRSAINGLGCPLDILSERPEVKARASQKMTELRKVFSEVGEELHRIESTARQIDEFLEELQKAQRRISIIHERLMKSKGGE